MSTPDSLYEVDYLNPLTARFDAKKSPLALLAQTCSSIGRDSSLSLIPSLEIKDEGITKDINCNKSSKSCNDIQANSETLKKDALISEEKEYLFYSRGSKSSQDSHDIKHNLKSSSLLKQHESDKNKSKFSSENIISSKRHSPSSWMTKSHSHKKEIMETYSPSNSLILPNLHSFKRMESANAHLNNCYAGLNEYLGYSYDQAYNLFLHRQVLSLNSKSGLNTLHEPSNTQSFLSYPHVQNVSGLSNFTPVCRDPYCSGCNAKPPTTHSSCNYGCTQCSDKTHINSSTSGLPKTVRYIPETINYNTNSDAGNSSVNSGFSGGLGKHYACNWIAGTEYCGQRFSTSEDLITHLRTHTSSIESHAALYAYYAGLPLTPSGNIPGSCNLQYPPQSTSPNSFRRTYSRSLSPTSILSSSRYHPYKSQYSSLYPAVNLSGYTPDLPYYSAYNLYGNRLGSVL